MNSSNIDIYGKIVGRILERVFSVSHENDMDLIHGYDSSWSMIHEKTSGNFKDSILKYTKAAKNSFRFLKNRKVLV
jgi:hypothetical protein